MAGWPHNRIRGERFPHAGIVPIMVSAASMSELKDAGFEGSRL